jgi:hypothetical protein
VDYLPFHSAGRTLLKFGKQISRRFFRMQTSSRWPGPTPSCPPCSSCANVSNWKTKAKLIVVIMLENGNTNGVISITRPVRTGLVIEIPSSWFNQRTISVRITWVSGLLRPDIQIPDCFTIRTLLSSDTEIPVNVH